MVIFEFILQCRFQSSLIKKVPISCMHERLLFNPRFVVRRMTRYLHLRLTFFSQLLRTVRPGGGALSLTNSNVGTIAALLPVV